MVSAERILEYGEIDLETDSADAKARENWPMSGAIEYKAVDLEYKACDKKILDNVNLHVESGMKVGIVGRTGAGKSSLITVLFRLAEPGGDYY